MKKSVIYALSILALLGLVLWLGYPQVTEEVPSEAPTTGASADEELAQSDSEAGENIPERAPIILDEFTIIRPPQELSGEGLYQDLRDAVESIQGADEVERAPINPTLTLPTLPTPTLPDSEEDEPEPEPIP